MPCIQYITIHLKQFMRILCRSREKLLLFIIDSLLHVRWRLNSPITIYWNKVKVMLTTIANINSNSVRQLSFIILRSMVLYQGIWAILNGLLINCLLIILLYYNIISYSIFRSIDNSETPVRCYMPRKIDKTELQSSF